jgi:hypothetical protein
MTMWFVASFKQNERDIIIIIIIIIILPQLLTKSKVHISTTGSKFSMGKHRNAFTKY